MSQNNRVASLIGACLLLVLTASAHAERLSLTDGHGDVEHAVNNLRQSIQDIVTQTAKGVDFADLQDEIAAISTGATELRNTLQKSFADALESYNETSALKMLLSVTLKTAVRNNPDMAAMILGQDPASGSGSKLALAIDMASLLEKELEGVDVTTIKIDTSEENDVAAALLTLSDAVMKTVEWMNEAVYKFLESQGSKDNETNKKQGMKRRQKRGWFWGGRGVRYTSRSGRWSVSGGPTFSGGKIGGSVGFRISF